ncbi:MAG: sigma-70 family RNA polymerase sigma factor [Clostridia bacterium]|nr:sigma-70 family RNA polymerase sigma factor [Clostridia bacterium]
MEELLLKAKDGDEQAFTKIILLINDDLYKVAKTRIKNEADIADAIQETIIETFKSINKINEPRKFKKWIIKVLINKCNRIYRRKYKKDISLEEYDFNYIKVNNISDIENELNFFDIINGLNYEERIILVLYYMEEYTVKEIKEILGMKENTINTHLYRARQKLKSKYEGGKIYD